MTRSRQAGRRRAIAGVAVLAAATTGALWWNALPSPLFDAPYSSIATARDGRLLGGRIASDGQWRFPMGAAVPPRFATALIAFEDRRFEHHIGVDPLAIARAAWLNMKHGEIVSGASTLSMQVIRLARGNPPRTFLEKVREAIMATCLEATHSKQEILELFAAHAPFGGNVVGLEAAAWRYFGRPPAHLSWAESATLAVLPNAPGLIHPARARDRLRERRDALLERLHADGHIDALELALALREPLPDAPRALPDLAGSLLDTLRGQYGTPRLRTVLDADIQQAAIGIVDRHADALLAAGVHNAAVLVIDNRNGDVVAYVANTGRPGMLGHGYALDLVRRSRSTGSLLKPFLYAAMLDAGELQPGLLIPDVPLHFDGFRPENYDRQFRGAVTARVALAHSLNVPAAVLLQRHGVERFAQELARLGMSTLFRAPDDYGLALVLGGAEGTLWDLTAMYANLARVARGDSPAAARLLDGERSTAAAAPSRAAAWLTLDTLLDVNRPGDERHWQSFASSRRIAWKTGTSHGLRDGWAIGVTPNYTVGVWVGNATGEGRAGLTGTSMAAPILFDIFTQLDTGGWFEKPQHDLKRIHVCRDDGRLPANGCETTTAEIPRNSHFQQVSVNHRWIHLDATGNWRVDARCESPADMQHQSWFVLPPVQEHFFRAQAADYRPLPPWRSDCTHAAGVAELDVVYPARGTSVYIPLDFGHARSRLVMQAVHRRDDATIHWHLDGRYLGSTQTFHELAVDIEPGRHELAIVDEQGARQLRAFTVLGETAPAAAP